MLKPRLSPTQTNLMTSLQHAFKHQCFETIHSMHSLREHYMQHNEKNTMRKHTSKAKFLEEFVSSELLISPRHVL